MNNNINERKDQTSTGSTQFQPQGKDKLHEGVRDNKSAPQGQGSTQYGSDNTR